MSLADRIAGNTLAIMAVALCWMILAPLVAGPIPRPQVHHICPAPEVIHGIGTDLKTYRFEIDRCSQKR